VTDPTGFYRFDDLGPARYQVQVSTSPPQPALADLTPNTPAVLLPLVGVREDVPDQDFGYCAECVCPDQSTDCSRGYHLVELELDVTVKCAKKSSWTNPWSHKSSKRGRDGKYGRDDDRDDGHADTHRVEVSVPGGSVDVSFRGDSWHGEVHDRVLVLTDAWRVKDCLWRVRIKLWACDVLGKRGCLPKSTFCVRTVVDCSSRLASLGLSGKHCLRLGWTNDWCGVPLFNVLRWVGCKDSECCPPHGCCPAGCHCPPTKCGCTRR
jgi:hypothetical protein